jgi:hypothetical protein
MRDKMEETITIEKHEYLKEEDYYETRSVNSGRTDKRCEYCGNIISKGVPHKMHHFYPEFESYPTHTYCMDNFIKSLN